MRKSAVKLIHIHSDSPADKAQLRPNDRLLALNGYPLEDELDLRFYLEEDEVDLEVQRGNSVFKVRIDLSAGSDPGWEVESLEVRSCKCDCKFCFVAQLPGGLRPSLYVKDEDYRFSFLFGNYLTLVGFTYRDLERVLRLRLSPLYVSIHATDPILRGRLLGLKKAPILPILRKLITGGIQIHGQIVLVPGYNDKEVLIQTLDTLKSFQPGLASLSVVPVGLTEHRLNLDSLRLVTRAEALSVLSVIGAVQNEMLNSTGSRWVFPADELLLLAGKPFPPDDEYEDFPQLDNGVGLVRWTISQSDKALNSIAKISTNPRHVLWVTGHSASVVLRRIAEKYMSRITDLHIEVIPVTNHLLGSSVTVAGLLGGQDITKAIREFLQWDAFGHVSDKAIRVYLPPSCLNSDDLLLDDWTVPRIESEIGLPVRAFDGDWEEMIVGIEQEAGV